MEADEPDVYKMNEFPCAAAAPLACPPPPIVLLVEFLVTVTLDLREMPVAPDGTLFKLFFILARFLVWSTTNR